MKQSLELPHLRHSSLLEAKEDKKPKATAAVSGGRRHVSCLKKKKNPQNQKNPKQTNDCRDPGCYCSHKFKIFSSFIFKTTVVGFLFS